MTVIGDVMDASSSMPSLSLAELGRIFGMLSDAWVSNFLLVSAPYEEAKLLMEPVQNMHKMSGEHVFTVKKSVTGLEEPRVLSRWLTIPVCNRDSKYAAGFYIQDKAPQMHFVRFVRDDETGQVIYITEIPETGSIEVMHTLLQGSKRRRSAYLRFDSLIFRQVVSHGTSISMSKLMDALVTSCMITEVSACKRCGSGPELNCGCQLGLQPAAHALDFRFYGPNSDHMFGDFHGVMTLSTYANGQERSCQSYHVQNFTKASSQQFSQGLLHEAVRNRLKLIPAQPRNLIMPTTAMDQNARQQTWNANGSCNINSITSTQTPSSSNSITTPSESGVAVDLCSAVDRLVDICNQELIDPLNVPRETTLLPAPVIASVNGVSRPVSVASNVIMDKAMRRKIKKREAAERSNSRRHFRRIELKRQLKEMREKETVSRKRLEELKEEREMLRMRLDAALLAEELQSDFQDVIDPDNDAFGNFNIANFSFDFRECGQLAEAFS